MLQAFWLGAALSVGQPPLPPADPLAPPGPVVPVRADTPAPAEPEPLTVTAPVGPAPAAAEEPEAAEAAAAPDRWFLMRALQGTYLGAQLDGHRMSIYGWTEMSFTGSTAAHSNQPVVLNDRANQFLLQQQWMRFERAVVTSGTSTPTYGFRVDTLYGADYRFTLPRGLWNSQLVSSEFNSDPARQNLYGIDLPQFYVEAYYPTVLGGLDVKVGKFFTPFGMESIEAISTPFMSRSYAFNWSPPFTHVGVYGTLTVNPKWTVSAGLVNGNDVFIDPAQELRGIGTVKYTQPGGRNTVTFGTSVGRGKFNAGEPFDASIIGLQDEAAGRNNINVFDLVWSHVVNSRLTYSLEVIYGYQTGVPTTGVVGVVPAALAKDDATHGTAHWGSIAQYLAYTITPRLSGALRLEFFDDFEGQRTGYEGLYTAVTANLTFKPRKDILFRPEVRYDYNGYRRPFDPDSTNTGRDHGIFTAGADLIIRW